MARAKKAPPPTHEEFVFHVRAPSLSYSFGIEHNRQRREWRLFDEHQTVSFVTECIWPDRFKGREGKGALSPEPALVDHKLLDDDDILRKRFASRKRGDQSVSDCARWPGAKSGKSPGTGPWSLWL